MKPSALPAATALLNAKVNTLSTWNHSKSSAERSANPEDCANRIFDGLAKVKAAYDGPRLSRSSAVFAMGSCFAREIEHALRRRGCNVISVDERIERPEFQDAGGKIRTGFFHRFTPFAMYQEFQQAFGEADGWDENTLIVEQGDSVVDLNYWDVSGSDMSREATMTRRRLAGELVRKAAEADVVILTLGLVESWFHKPSGLHANKVPAQTLIRRRDEFELHIVTYEETLACLEGIRSLIARHRKTPFQLVVTVSPVPMSKTFTSEDLIIANMTSKSTLRAAAAEFCRSTPEANYFPSYEMVTYSNPRLAWRPDRTHVESLMVRHIVNTFTDAYYLPGELGAPAPDAASASSFVGVNEDVSSGVEVNVSLLNQIWKVSGMVDAALPKQPPAV